MAKSEKQERNEKICPNCGKKYAEESAISRRDNKTEICPECGVNEALIDYFGRRN